VLRHLSVVGTRTLKIWQGIKFGTQSKEDYLHPTGIIGINFKSEDVLLANLQFVNASQYDESKFPKLLQKLKNL
jgi:hypothetical protein